MRYVPTTLAVLARFRRGLVVALLAAGSAAGLRAHVDVPPRQGLLHEFAVDAPIDPTQPVLRLTIVDASGRLLAARFELRVDDRSYDPATLGSHGIRFISEHTGKRQRLQVNYARGTGALEIGLPAGARRIEISAVRGFEFRPAAVTVEAKGRHTDVRLALPVWSNLAADGWIAIEEHLHYERLDPADDARWLAMLDAEGLQCAHFLVLRRQGDPGLTTPQYAYGPRGTAAGGGRLVVPGEEFRDNDQGHINLLGIREVIEPVMNIGTNWPANHDVLVETKKQGAVGGVAHGSLLGKHSTAVVDAVLGAAEFWEIANLHIYELARWYQLMNCGYFLPPTAGTDLPNYPFRDPWQPFLGGVRTYVRMNTPADATQWQTGLRRGEVFVTSGPLIRLSVSGQGPGGIVRLPSGGGDVSVEAELSSPLTVRQLELVHSGVVVAGETTRIERAGIQSLRIRRTIPFTESGWLAARGTGGRIAAMDRDSFAHTGVVRVLVGDAPVRSAADAGALIAGVRGEMEHYRDHGLYPGPVEREHVQAIFRRAIALLAEQKK